MSTENFAEPFLYILFRRVNEKMNDKKFLDLMKKHRIRRLEDENFELKIALKLEYKKLRDLAKERRINILNPEFLIRQYNNWKNTSPEIFDRSKSIIKDILVECVEQNRIIRQDPNVIPLMENLIKKFYMKISDRWINCSEKIECISFHHERSPRNGNCQLNILDLTIAICSECKKKFWEEGEIDFNRVWYDNKMMIGK
jgi:hypothetical protein